MKKFFIILLLFISYNAVGSAIVIDHSQKHSKRKIYLSQNDICIQNNKIFACIHND